MKNIKGFTLIELLVVVAIIGILAAVGTVAYTGYTEGAKKNSAAVDRSDMLAYTSRGHGARKIFSVIGGRVQPPYAPNARVRAPRAASQKHLVAPHCLVCSSSEGSWYRPDGAGPMGWRRAALGL